MNSRPKQGGLTLLELLTVVAIVGILAAIVVPNYQSNIRKARRADGQSVMLELSQWMERFYTVNGRYDQDRAGTAVTAIVPAVLLSSPKGQANTFYTFVLSNLAQESFTITATPTNAQVGDICANLTLTQTGAKGTSAAGYSVDQCWQ
ncbi:MAG: type IV pilin protein [Pseudomonadota bacterium]